MLSWTVWVPAIALSVIAFIVYRRLAVAGSFLSHRGARLAALQVVAFVLLTGATSAAELTCANGERRCTSCTYSEFLQSGWVFGEECQGGTWWNEETFFGDGNESEACEQALEECDDWTQE